MPKEKPERGTPEYAIYKAEKKARKERRAEEREAEEADGIYRTSSTRERISGSTLTVQGQGKKRSSSRIRSSSRRRDGSASGSENDSDSGVSAISRRSHRRSHSHAGSSRIPSPPIEVRKDRRRADTTGGTTSKNGGNYYSAAGGSIGYGHGPQQPSAPIHYQGSSHIPPKNSGPPSNDPGSYGNSNSSGRYGVSGNHGKHSPVSVSPVSPVSSPGSHPQDSKYGSHTQQGKYGVERPQFPSASPNIYANSHPPPRPGGYPPGPSPPVHGNSYPAPSSFTPAPPSQFGHQSSGPVYSGAPGPTPPQNGSNYPPPPQNGNTYPPLNSHSPMPTAFHPITSGAEQTSSPAPFTPGAPGNTVNPFQFQTGGPEIGSAVTVGPPPAPVASLYGGNPAPPPNLDPNHPGPLPGEGAGKVYPPGQEPPQYSNPDYYADVLSDTHTSQSLSHSMVAAEGLSASGMPPKPSYLSNNGNGKPSKPSKPGFLGGTLGLPSLSIMTGGGGGSHTPQPMPSPALQPYYGTYQSISPLPSPTLPPQSSSPLFSASGSVSLGKHSASGSFALGPPAFPRPSKNSHQQIEQQEQNGHHGQQQISGHGSSHQHTMSQTSLSSVTGGYESGHGHGHSQSSSQIYTTIPPPSPLIPSSRESSPEPTPSYDPTNDAKAILQQLKSTFSRPSPRPLIKILPTLTPPQLNMLRREYKQLYRGVNLAKHLKAVFTTSSPFGKIIFAVALGPYESEAWFANSWYQKKETRNELLIESLMGRTNPEIGNIKAAFKDAKYDASLEKAVQTELHSNKFRLAVMMQLSCTRMEDGEQLNTEKIHDDVARLGNILERRKEGGETEMVEIIINRSDPWLREIAATYRRVYERDLMKAIMKRSKNLVGETLLHVLNGAVDKPLRDAKLLDQAITAVLEENREDLLISRATRIHWDPKHLELVKRAFRKKYRKDLGVRIKEAARGSYQDFLLRMVRE